MTVLPLVCASAAYSFTGLDGPAHMAEESANAAVANPKGIMAGVYFMVGSSGRGGSMIEAYARDNPFQLLHRVEQAGSVAACSMLHTQWSGQGNQMTMQKPGHWLAAPCAPLIASTALPLQIVTGWIWVVSLLFTVSVSDTAHQQ
jgi:amino acid transporter